MEEEIILKLQTKFQQIVLKRWKDGINLFLDGCLQFSSRDEYRYHETLVHPAMSLNKKRKNILVLGGGDGLAVREILKYNEVKKISLVDIDPEIVELFSIRQELLELNKNSINHSKVSYFPEDAWVFVQNTQEKFDVIIVDLPDPEAPVLSKLYSDVFYRRLGDLLCENGILSVQGTSPYFHTNTYWCIFNTIRAASFETKAIQTFLQTFGAWGFVLASKRKFKAEKIKFKIKNNRYLLEGPVDKALFDFPEEIAWRLTMTNTLQNNAIMYYYYKNVPEYLRWLMPYLST